MPNPKTISTCHRRILDQGRASDGDLNGKGSKILVIAIPLINIHSRASSKSVGVRLCHTSRNVVVVRNELFKTFNFSDVFRD